MPTVNIFNEAGTGTAIATGTTNNQMSDQTLSVTNIALAAGVTIEPKKEYQIEFPPGNRTGRMCTAFDAHLNTATFGR
jgi:hypothetical protein